MSNDVQAGYAHGRKDGGKKGSSEDTEDTVKLVMSPLKKGLEMLVRRFGKLLTLRRSERKMWLWEKQNALAENHAQMAIFLDKNELNQTDYKFNFLRKTKVTEKHATEKPIELKPAYELFAQFMAHGFGQSESAKLARYSEKSAHVTANRLLKNDKIRKRIAQIQAGIAVKLDDRPIATAEQVLREVTASALAQQGKETTAGYTVNITDKLKSLEHMGKHHKLFADRVVLESDIGSAPPEQLKAAVESSRERLRKHIESRQRDCAGEKQDGNT